ncbi:MULTISPECIES: phosphotransferase [Micromonospora]|uniref:Aminoglycoside phosphotransferase family protein n=1 Tax=Micromonospora solifontis TaxID=2487138 RepID=A0ABX9WKT3_9ACTN|nr:MULTISPECIES: phosphotransferase [Micromonospora]NES16324.1 phosphotransferase [Micromonospora sp. PPF5-17B]NES36174.1 phosphotransferase [Micromonospora solifontis]NES59177.1 phosphotransferase [Micromonospora sp. PPF5-6]RNL99766.1 aminoglycoside phosphotransferase family protein [Micromonospora solifontis]
MISSTGRFTAGWRPDAHAWLADELARHGHRVTGEVTTRVRPWSEVWQVPTAAGPVWFKANNPGTRYEAALLAELARLAPGAVLDPIAVDAGRGWSLLPDGGPSLRDVLAGGPDPSHWERVLPAYAALQIAIAPQAEQLIAAGVPDQRPASMPALLDGLLDDEEALLLGAEDGLSPELHERLRAYRPEFDGLCRRLAEIGIAASIQHDDLHDGNVFVTDAGYRFFDWGDASVAHPFGTLLVTLRSVAYGAELTPGDPVLHRLRDAYLEAWTDRYDRATLREAAGLAMTVATVSRALSWRRALHTPDPARAEYAAAVPGWLGEVFGANPA